MKYNIEVCADSLQSAINAESGGASRIELCNNLEVGGTTPSASTIELTVEKLNIPVFVLIRPRGGDFVYSDFEFEIMKKDILFAKEAGVKGIVSGMLLPDGRIDMDRCRELVDLTRPLQFTFHRAFDQVPDPFEGIETLLDLGADRILTSGQEESALKGIELIKKLVKGYGDKIEVMPGGGVKAENIIQMQKSGCREFHFSARTEFEGRSKYPQKVKLNGHGIPELQLKQTNADRVRQIKNVLNACS